ncbi:MAG: carboxypeptidase-like regulatory domain-containing protein, partial [Vicinamibacteraceae bacterium]
MLKAVLVVLISLLLAASASAQTAALTGVVSDPDGATIPEATVTVTNADTGSTRVVQTNREGAYVIPQLPP